jgi:hypothetical protein
MARDKTKDDLYFNCSQPHEKSYVACLYPGDADKVEEFLTFACKTNAIHNSTHKEVYDLINKKLGLQIPPVK